MKKPPYPTRDDLVTAWITMHHSAQGNPEYEDNFWSFTYLDNLTSEYPEESFEVIKTILSRDSSNEIMQVLAAGPLEDLLNRHGDANIDRIEGEAESNRSFRKLLGGVWKSHIDPAVWARVQLIWDRKGWDGILVSVRRASSYTEMKTGLLCRNGNNYDGADRAEAR